MDRHSKLGFTLVELLVVIAIIGILVALLLPAVQSSREMARRSSCLNQLRQLSMTLHNYEHAKEHFPAGVSNPAGPIRNLPEGDHKSWIARLLPYFGEQVRYRKLDWQVGVYHKNNDPVRQTTIEILVCPSSSSYALPSSNYAGIHHASESPIDADNNGLLFLNSKLKYDDLTDGAGYTFAIGEKRFDSHELGWLSGTPSTLRNLELPINEWGEDDDDPYEPAWYTGSYPESLGGFGDFGGDSFGGFGEEAFEDPVDEEGEEVEERPLDPWHQEGGNPETPLAVGGFASEHPGGTHFSLADGSSRFISDDTDTQLLQRLGNREDGAMIDGVDLR